MRYIVAVMSRRKLHIVTLEGSAVSNGPGGSLLISVLNPLDTGFSALSFTLQNVERQMKLFPRLRV